ncbi:MAG TPA: ribulose-phosphate 3-epimerase [Candidatus Nanoarchaeia archaeon]|nr:ribulose-phosphate 3-epimerase [Candidatus Nanoarchaeia archaeon]
MIVKIAASILSLDWSDKIVIDQAVMRVSNADFIHFDVMDGKFVKDKTFDSEFVKSISTGVIKKDVHLMTKQPEKLVDKFINAGASMISFHAEATKSPKKLIEKIKSKGVMAGIAINPSTSLTKIDKLLDQVDFVLIMTVKPGKPGQKLIASAVKKVKSLTKKKPNLIIEVDGGINADTAHEVIEAGADILVAGSYIFNSPDPKIAGDILRNA